MAGFVLGPGKGPLHEFHGSMVVIKASGEDTKALVITGPSQLDRQIATRGGRRNR